MQIGRQGIIDEREQVKSGKEKRLVYKHHYTKDGNLNKRKLCAH